MNRKRALVVDDEAAIARLLRRVLSAAGWDVAVASSGHAATRAFRVGRFRLLVTDVDIGDIDGVALAGDFRSLDPALTVVVMSGTADHLQRAREAGFDCVLSKPFDLDEVRVIASRTAQAG